MFKSLLFAIALLTVVPVASAETWKVASLDWQPFSGKDLPEGGAGIAVLRAALKAEGIDLEVEFYPWSRALEKGAQSDFVGIYPSWPEEVPAGFVGSAMFFQSPVGFVEPKGKPLNWSSLDDLKGKKIGIVQDYGNTVEFMKLVDSGAIDAKVAVDDLTNIRKVAGKRIDGAFIDLNNLDYFLKHDAKNLASKVQANGKILDSKDLLLSINENFAEKDVNDIVIRGISKIDADAIIKNYMDKYVK